MSAFTFGNSLGISSCVAKAGIVEIKGAMSYPNSSLFPTRSPYAESILEVLFDSYNESTSFDNAAIKADFEKLCRLINGKSLKEIGEIIYAVCTLCRNHEKAGFIEGMKVGISMAKEFIVYLRPFSSCSR